MTGGYWPWWAGAAALAAVAVGSCLVGRRPLGVSGVLARVLGWRGELAAERQRAALEAADEAALEAALEAATAEAFAGMAGALEAAGPAALSCALPVAAPAAGPGVTRGVTSPCHDCGAPAARPTLGAHAVFLGGIVAGAFLATALRGEFHPTLALPEAFARLVAPGGWGLLALGAGGLLVGVGAAVSGGCSLGHGLSGAARLQPAGLAATATFLCAGAAVSLLLAAGAR